MSDRDAAAGERSRRRPRRDYESLRDLSPFLGRMLAALVRRADDGDLDALIALAELRAGVNQAIGDAAVALHDPRPGEPYSWTDIGAALGISRQAAYQQYGRNKE